MVYEARKQVMARIQRELQISLKRYALSMEDKMAARDFWVRRPFKFGLLLRN